MPFARPVPRQLVDRIATDIEARLQGADARLRRRVLGVLAIVHAGATHGLYGNLDWMARQVIYDTAEAEILERWADIWGVTRLAAAPAEGDVNFTGVNGSVIPAGTLLARADGAEFETDAEATIALGVATAAVAAVAAGAAGNTLAGSALGLVAPVAGVTSQATVAAGGLVGGADTETDQSLRARFLTRLRQPPHGGADFDYVEWAKQVAGVTRAWVYPGELGLGTVSVRFVRDNDVSIIPDAGEVTAVQDHIDALRPVTAALTVVAPIADALNFTFTTLAPNTAAVKAAVEAELRDLLLRESEPGATILLTHIREAVSNATGEHNYVMTAPAADVAHATGHMATFGAIAWP